MYSLILILSLPAGALALPLQVRLTANLLNRKLGMRANPGFGIFSVLGAIIGLMIGIAIIQFSMVGYELPLGLVMPTVFAVFIAGHLALAVLFLLFSCLVALCRELFGCR